MTDTPLLKRLELSGEGLVPIHITHLQKDCRDAHREIKRLMALAALEQPMKTKRDHHRDLADTISRLWWENFMRTEPALQMRDCIAIELDKAYDRGLADGKKSQLAAVGPVTDNR